MQIVDWQNLSRNSPACHRRLRRLFDLFITPRSPRDSDGEFNVINHAQLKEALLNLLLNGGEAIENGHGAIHIEEGKEKITSGGQAITIKVTDNGIGICEAVREKMFQPFFTTKETGTGLGLCIAKRIVEAHGGRISVQSRAGHETAVALTLPSPGATTPGSAKENAQAG